MKVLVVLCAVVASCLAKPNIGYAYSAISPLTGYSSIAAPYSYAYSAPIISAYAAPYAAAPYAPIAPITPVAPAAVKTQYHSQDELGQAKYGHTEPFQAHDAVQDAHGNKIGSFSYVDPHGGFHRRDYVADSLGFRVAANDLPVAPAGPGPVVPAETPEVVAAKAHHFAAHHEATAAALHYRKRRNANNGPPIVTPNGHLADTPEVAGAAALHYRERRNAYYGPHALPIVTPSGHLADTPEVAAAKAAHFAEHARQAGHAVPYAAPYAHGHYAGPYATPVVTPSGHLADTPEVAAAKAAHFAEHARQSGHVAYAAPYAHGHYAGPYATPVVTPSGFLADTPEVAAAKHAHFAEHAARGKRSLFYQTPASTSPLAAPLAHPIAPVAYAAPLAHYAPVAHPAPLAYAAPALGVPAIKTEIVHNPGHAFSYRIDSLAHPHIY